MSHSHNTRTQSKLSEEMMNAENVEISPSSIEGDVSLPEWARKYFAGLSREIEKLSAEINKIKTEFAHLENERR